MTEVIGVKFHPGGKLYYFNPNGLQIAPGKKVLIETAKGIELGECVAGNTFVDELELVTTLRPVLRIATEQDLERARRAKIREKEALSLCRKKVAEHGLDMKLVRAEVALDGKKMVFYFTAEGRIDFRALVKDLAASLHTRIELRQIGVRDEARTIGGLGVCGRPYCCQQHMSYFHPVSIKMAKTQGVSLNPTKISGCCGRLMCCLQYEQEAYEDLIKRAPRLHTIVKTPDGVGVINQINLLREQSTVALDQEPEAPRVYPNDQLEPVNGPKPAKDYPPKPVHEDDTTATPQPTRSDPNADADDASDPSGAHRRRRRHRGKRHRGPQTRENNS